MPERESGRLLVEREQVELGADLAVIALLRLLEPLQVRVERILGEEGGAAHALHRDARRVAAPVCARHAQQLEVLQPARVGEVRPLAHVGERARVVEGDLVFRDLVDVVDLQLVADPLEAVLGLLAAHAGTRVRPLLGGDLAHPLLDLGEVLLGQRLGGAEVVVEPVVGRGAESEVGAREQLQDGHGEQVRGAVAEHEERLGVPGGQDPEVRRRGDRARHLDDVAVDDARHGRLGQPAADAFRHLQHRGAGGDLSGRTVGQAELDLGGHGEVPFGWERGAKPRPYRPGAASASFRSSRHHAQAATWASSGPSAARASRAGRTSGPSRASTRPGSV